MNKTNRDILLICSNSSEVDVIKLMLSDYTEHLVTTSELEEAVRLFNSNAYELILLDGGFPGNDDFFVLKKIKKSAENKDTKVIILSSLSDRKMVESGIGHGASDYILKPFNKDELFLRVQIHLQSTEIHRKLQKSLQENKAIQKELKKERNLYHSLFEDAPIPIWEEDFSEVKNYLNKLLKKGVTNLSNYLDNNPDEVLKISAMVKVININQRTVHFYKKRNKKEVIQDLVSYFTDKSIPVFKNELVAFWGGATEFNCEIEILIDGKLMILLGHVAIVPGCERDWKRVIFSFIDITEKKNFEEKIISQNFELVSLNATKDKLFTVISHDLKTPFNLILGLSNLLADEKHETSKEEQKEFIKSINETARQTLKLFNNLLDWSLMNVDRIPFNPEVFRIVDLFKNNANLKKTFLEKKKINLECKASNNLYIYADKNMVDTVIRNLITNAIKFSNEGSTVFCSAKLTPEKSVLVSIKDSGVGMGKYQLENLFKIEKSFSTKGTNGEAGTGVGIILCKEFIEKNEGRIWAKSEKGKGSEFLFTLPSPSQVIYHKTPDSIGKAIG